MRQVWKEKREKTLLIPDALIEYIAERSHQENERSGNKEGGRIVEKLIAELVEENIQREQSEREDEYKEARSIEIIFSPSEVDFSSERKKQPRICVDFHKN
jgi:hypothetical protein